jgi:hypothetical protein
LQELPAQIEYGLIAAGAVATSLAGRLAQKGGLGPVVGVSYRVASRIANTMRAGTPARSSAALDPLRLVLFFSPPEQIDSLIEALNSVEISWAGKSVVIVDCDPPALVPQWFTGKGASLASIRHCGIPGRLRVEGSGPALLVAQRMVRDLGMRAIEIPPGTEKHFEAAMLAGTAALTPLIDQTVDLFRRCGMRDSEAVAVGTTLFEQTARAYGYSGRQSWDWHNRAPESEELLRVIEGAPAQLRPSLRRLLIMGCDAMDRHLDLAEALRAPTSAAAKQQK